MEWKLTRRDAQSESAIYTPTHERSIARAANCNDESRPESSIDFDSRRFDELAVGYDVVGHHFREFLRRRGLQHYSVHAHAVLQLGDVDDASPGNDLVPLGGVRRLLAERLIAAVGGEAIIEQVRLHRARVRRLVAVIPFRVVPDRLRQHPAQHPGAVRHCDG